jgi:hypothetical protein
VTGASFIDESLLPPWFTSKEVRLSGDGPSVSLCTILHLGHEGVKAAASSALCPRLGPAREEAGRDGARGLCSLFSRDSTHRV